MDDRQCRQEPRMAGARFPGNHTTLLTFAHEAGAFGYVRAIHRYECQYPPFRAEDDMDNSLVG